MTQINLTLRVSSKSDVDAGAATDFLADAISPHVDELTRSSVAGAQDFGATLTIILGSAFLVEIARGIADCIRRDRSSAIVIEYPDGRRTAISNVSEATVESIYEDLKGHTN